MFDNELVTPHTGFYKHCEEKGIWKHCVKKKIASYKQVLLFTQCFLPFSF